MSGKKLRSGLVAAVANAALFFTAAASGTAGAASSARHAPKPTIVLVHGVFADASGWDAVIKDLEKQGYPVLAPANPLRGVATDAAYLSSIIDTIPGPVIMVGHSYGGEVITNAANGHPNVKALVYVAAFAPDAGETALQLAGMFPGSQLPTALTIRPYTLPGGGTGEDAYIAIDKFHAVFAADLPAQQAAVMAVEQRPADVAGLATPSGPPAWKTLPSWYLVAGADQVIPPAAELFMAHRAHARTVEIKDSSHVAMISHPEAVTDLITEAAQATG